MTASLAEKEGNRWEDSSERVWVASSASVGGCGGWKPLNIWCGFGCGCGCDSEGCGVEEVEVEVDREEEK